MIRRISTVSEELARNEFSLFFFFSFTEAYSTFSGHFLLIIAYVHVVVEEVRRYFFFCAQAAAASPPLLYEEVFRAFLLARTRHRRG